MFRFKRLSISKSLTPDLKELLNQQKNTENRFYFKGESLHIIPNENTKKTYFDRHYIYHTAWANRKLIEITPKKHVDISSSLYFSALASAHTQVEFYDYRPPNLILDNFTAKSGDLCDLPFESNSVESISCMHVVEHVGLGRYGDPIDYDGDLKAMSELIRVLKLKGHMLFVVPIGKPKIIFNAHRIYSYRQIKKYFSELKLIEFTLIPENENKGHLISHASEEQADAEDYGCGCFLFRKE
ncbi:MAG: DUF268 domain-containing protein [Cyclobacteriaceae bacterium]